MYLSADFNERLVGGKYLKDIFFCKILNTIYGFYKTEKFNIRVPIGLRQNY